MKPYLSAAILGGILVTQALHSTWSQEPSAAPAQLPVPAGGSRSPDAGPSEPGRPPFLGFFGGPMRQEIKLVEKFDKDGNDRLDQTERKAAREFLATERAEGRLGRFSGGSGGRGRPGGRPPGGEPATPGAPAQGEGRPPREFPVAPVGPGFAGGPGFPGGPGGFPFGPGGNRPPATPGLKVTPDEAKAYPGAHLYDPQVMRTLFFEFDSPDWEKELADFKDTDVEVPARLQVDGKTYEDVGVHFRGASSFMMVPDGYKRSLNVSLDFVHEKQDLGGYKTLNLLNSNGDPTLLRAMLYNQIAREYLPAPKTSYTKVVINGESWGVYVNVQQFNKDFIKEWYGTKKGARWKAPGRPNGNSGLEYLGEDVAKYRERFEIKSKDNPEDWTALMNLCRVLNQTPAAELEAVVSPILDVEGALRFLALENIFINTDGYWTRASDYNLYRGEDGRFHVIPHDTNETFRTPEGPGMRRPGGGGGERSPGRKPGALPEPRPEAAGRESGRGVDLSPIAGADDERKPLLNKLLAVPALRTRYLQLVQEITERWCNWERIEPLARQYQAVIAEEVEKDTRKLASFEQFQKGVAEDVEEQGFRGPRRSLSLKSFIEQRRAFLLSHPEITRLSGTSQVR